MEVHLKITGVILVLLAFLHLIFPRYFNWKTELSSLSLINRQLMYVHTFFIGLVVFLMGVFCITSSSEILNTRLGKQLSLGMFIFWCARLIFQFCVYSPALWRGKRFEFTIHVLFSLMWLYFSMIFFLVYWL